MFFSYRVGKFCFEHYEGLPSDVLQRISTLHRHEEFQMLYVRSTNIEIDIENRHYRMRPFSLVLIKPGEMHNFSDNASMLSDYFLIRFPEEGIPKHFLPALRSLANIYIIPGTKLSEEIERMDDYCRDIDGAYIEDVLMHHLPVILGYACNFVGMRNVPNHSTVNAEYVINHINRNLTNIHSIYDISRLTHLSPSSIKKMVSQRLHQPVMHYVRTQKCLLAQKLLRRGHSATQVCYQCGFRNYSTFYRAYLKVCGEMPSSCEKMLPHGNVPKV